MMSLRLLVGMYTAACCLPATGSKAEESKKAAAPAADSMPGKKAGEIRDDNVTDSCLSAP
jgi:hypothetical protein